MNSSDNTLYKGVKTPCVLECYYDKELQCCGSCFRTLEDIREAGIIFKNQRKNENKRNN